MCTLNEHVPINKTTQTLIKPLLACENVSVVCHCRCGLLTLSLFATCFYWVHNFMTLFVYKVIVINETVKNFANKQKFVKILIFRVKMIVRFVKIVIFQDC